MTTGSLPPTLERVVPRALESARLVLRPLVPDDAEALFAVFGDAEAMAYWSCRPHATVEATRAMVQALYDACARGAAFHWTVVRREDGAVIGKAAISSWQGPNRRGDISYILAPAAWGRGFATEAVRLMLDFGFDVLGLHSIEAGVTPGNDSSAHVLRKLGFRLEGHLKENYWAEDRFVDSLVHGMLAREWAERRSAEARA